MPEKLIEICQSIVNSKNTLSKNNINSIVARYHTTFNDMPKTLWLYLNPQNSRNNFNLDGDLVYRNSIAGSNLINQPLGTEWSYNTINNLHRTVVYKVHSHNKTIYENKTIEIENDSVVYKYVDIYDFLKKLKENSEIIKENEELKVELSQKYNELEKLDKTKELSNEKARITKEINKIEENLRIAQLQQEDLKNLTRFIRKQGQLRFNPILDPTQNKIKTSHLYDGITLIINGGPGTGKTTTLIQRLKYLIDETAINEDLNINEGKNYRLDKAQRTKLIDLTNINKDWMFFSPSQLLKQYLSDAMNKEGLSNTNTKVQNWDDFRRRMMLEYNFFNPASPEDAPFKNCIKETQLFDVKASPINDFNNYYVNQFNLIPKKFPNTNKKNYSWYRLALSIEGSFKSNKLNNLDEIIMLFFNLEDKYGLESNRLLDENKKLISDVSNLIQVKLNDIYDTKKQIDELLFSDTESLLKNEDDEFETVDILNDEESEDLNFNEDRSLIFNKEIKVWLKKYCLNQLDKSIKLSDRQTKINNILSNIMFDIDIDQIHKIGELALFEIYAKYTNGIEKNLLSGMSNKYKSFRRHIIKSKNVSWNIDLLNELIGRSKGKELHKQEQSLLLGFTNNLIKKIIKVLPTYKLKNKYYEIYREYNRPIIGIDEATDFSIVDIYSMTSFLSTEFNSLTLSGDVMQRLTDFGLNNWNSLEQIIPNKVVVNMTVSYRQSTLLLDVAKRLYHDTIGHDPDYMPYLKDKRVPKPISIISENEIEKTKWIENRIKEVYKAYDNKLPSIAIFLNDVNEIPSFVRELSNCDFFNDSGIRVVDGSSGIVLAEINDVRVYPINVVKGMEFDVVFFHNIDNGHFNEDITKRYVYVGLSRAAFFLAATFKQNNRTLSQYFAPNSDWSKII